ncbi:MAG: hypothetical protein ACRD6W_04745, partial [Nitrososphaerales archaeon]
SYGGANRGDKPAQPAPPPVLPNSFVLQHGFYGSTQPFVARPFEARMSARNETAEDTSTTQPADGEPTSAEVDADAALTKRILQEVKAYESPSMQSLVSYLSAEFPKPTVQGAIDKLEKDGLVKLSPKQHKSGRMMLALELTPKGTEFLGGVA